MLGVVSAHIGVMERIACGFGVYGQGVGGLLSLPLLDQRVDCINKAVLRHGVEEAVEVVVGGVEVDVSGCLGEIAVEVAP